MQILVLQKGLVTKYKLVKFSSLEIGEETSYGYLVLQKQYLKNSRFYDYDNYVKEYYKELHKRNIKEKKNNKIKNILSIIRGIID